MAFIYYRTTLLGIPLPRFFTSSRTQRSYGSVKVWKITSSHPLRERRALIATLETLDFDGITISFSAFRWAVIPPRHDARNLARKAWLSRTSEIKMGVLIGRSPVGTQVLATWV